MKKSQLRQLIREAIKSSYVNEMQAINKETGKDITRHILDYMEKKITKKEFEELTGLSKDTNEAIKEEITSQQFVNMVNDEFDVETLELMKQAIEKQITMLSTMQGIANRKTVKGFGS